MTAGDKTDLPRWEARDKADAEKMHRWVNEHLDVLPDPELDALIDSGYELTKAAEMSVEEHALWLAELDEMELLRELNPQLAKYLHPQKRGRGEHVPRVPTPCEVRAQLARRDVQRIRKLWKAEYGHDKRRRDSGPSAEEIAARRWNVTVNAIENLGKRGKAR